MNEHAEASDESILDVVCCDTGEFWICTMKSTLKLSIKQIIKYISNM